MLSLNYGFQRANQNFALDDIPVLAEEAIRVINLCLTKKYEEVYFISKSIGTIIASEVRNLMGDNGIKMIFMTPLRDSISKIKNCHCLIITGSKDKLFDSESIEIIKGLANAKIIIIEGANHSLEIEDDYKQSLKILNEVVDLCVSFIDRKGDCCNEG